MIQKVLSIFLYCFLCRWRSKIFPITTKEEEYFIAFLDNGIELNTYQRSVLNCRIIPVLQKYQKDLFWVKYFYIISRVFLQSCSLLIPALLGTTINLFWVIWTLSLFVGIMTNVVHMFRWDRKYYLLHRTHQLLIAEMWYFMERIQGYELQDFQQFCERFEKIHHSYQQDENVVLKKATSYLTPITRTPVSRNDPLANDPDLEYLNPIQISPT